jgi:hypothetical protein
MREIRTSGSMSGGGKRSTAETEAPALRRKPPATATPSTYGYRARRRLYPFPSGTQAKAAGNSDSLDPLTPRPPPTVPPLPLFTRSLRARGHSAWHPFAPCLVANS